MWLSRDFHRYFGALDETKADLTKLTKEWINARWARPRCAVQVGP
jgi:hypothetical protein